MIFERDRLEEGRKRYSLKNATVFREEEHPRADDGKFGKGGGGSGKSEKQKSEKKDLAGKQAASYKKGKKIYETGKPIEINYYHNPVSSKKFVKGNQYQQDIEPSGKYVTEATEGMEAPSGWEKGVLKFNNPLVLKWNQDENGGYDEGSWKAHLSKQTGKKGKALTTELKKQGYDGIITIDKYGTSEIISLDEKTEKSNSSPIKVYRAPR